VVADEVQVMKDSFMRRLLTSMRRKYGPVPGRFTFGDGIDWASELVETYLYVELPFWLMTPAGHVDIAWSGATFRVEISPPWMEVFVGQFMDSRASCIYQGPQQAGGYQPSEEVRAALAERPASVMERHCKSVLRLKTRAHTDAFRPLGDTDPPRAHREHDTYLASLCEAHLPVVNELIRRYRLVTYDYFASEVSPWDVPIWYVRHGDHGEVAVIHPYRQFDVKPVISEDAGQPGDPPTVREFEWCSRGELEAMSTADATPGEFDLLDARSLMERGDFTGALRRSVSAIEAIAEWALRNELRKRFDPAEAEERLRKTDLDVPGRLRQWRKLSKAPVSDTELAEFETTRDIRHDIVHRARRLTIEDRGRAERAIDTTRWLYNKIEERPERARLRDHGVLKSAGRYSMAPHFPAVLDAQGLTIGPLSLPDPQVSSP
jgi:hypothetical protein